LSERRAVARSGRPLRGHPGARAGAGGAPATDAARLKALALLARRDYGRRALELRLARAGFSVATVVATLDALGEERLLDEARTVENAVRSRIARGQGPLRILAELNREGLPRDLIGAAVQPLAPVWTLRARAARRKRFGAALPAATVERGREARFLRQRGFSHAQIGAALGSGADESVPEDDWDHVNCGEES